MKLKQALTLAGEKLAALKDIDAPTFEAEVLLRHCLHINRAQLYLKFQEELSASQAELFFSLIDRRLKGEPTAYIMGKREFFGLEFEVDRRALIPRPETELLVEQALQFFRLHPVQSAADVGTGSGIIAVSLAVDLFHRAVQSARLQVQPDLRLYAVDISSQALDLARCNAVLHAVEDRITFLHGDLLNPLPGPCDLIIANLPYVSSAEVRTMPSAVFEPQSALDGGENGLDLILRLIDCLPGWLNPGGCALLEIGLGQSADVTAYLKTRLPQAHSKILPDLSGIDRVVKIQL